MSTRSSFRRFGQFLWESLQKPSIGATTALATGISLAGAGVYSVISEQQKFQLEREKLALQKEQFQNQIELQREQFNKAYEFESKKLDLIESRKISSDQVCIRPFVTLNPDDSIKSSLPLIEPTKTSLPNGPHCFYEKNIVNIMISRFYHMARAFFEFF